MELPREEDEGECGMKEEELQELEEWYLDDGELHELQILKLIDIAKRFNDIQIENAKLSIMLRDTQSHLFDIEQQNKRYFESIEEIRGYMETGSIMMLSEEDRLKGIHEILKKHYNTKQ